jgi:hypothetical protein
MQNGLVVHNRSVFHLKSCPLNNYWGKYECPTLKGHVKDTLGRKGLKRSEYDSRICLVDVQALAVFCQRSLSTFLRKNIRQAQGSKRKPTVGYAVLAIGNSRNYPDFI